MQAPINKTPTNPSLLEGQKFGTFHGVFRPTLLTIIGVMLYLRECWLVGNAGLFGAILVILTAYLITGMTALSISSITSNTRVGAGGVFSLVSQSLTQKPVAVLGSAGKLSIPSQIMSSSHTIAIPATRFIWMIETFSIITLRPQTLDSITFSTLSFRPCI